jgi:hypothetical protein
MRISITFKQLADERHGSTIQKLATIAKWRITAMLRRMLPFNLAEYSKPAGIIDR